MGRRTRAATVLAGLALMIGVPATTLGADEPSRFGWQMYATYTDLPQVEIQYSDGAREQIDVRDLVAGSRSEVSYSEPIAKHLCSRAGHVAFVTLTRETASRQETFECASF